MLRADPISGKVYLWDDHPETHWGILLGVSEWRKLALDILDVCQTLDGRSYNFPLPSDYYMREIAIASLHRVEPNEAKGGLPDGLGAVAP